MDHVLYYGIVFGALIGIGLLLHALRVDPVFTWTFILLGSIFMSVSVWEALNETWLGLTHIYWFNGVAHFYWFSLWWMTIAITAASFFIMYIVFQAHVAQRIVWDKTIALGAEILGIAMMMGVAEDFGVFTMWGFDHFNLVDAPWHQSYINGTVPTFYLWLIPGIILTGIALWWSVQHHTAKRALSARTAWVRGLKIPCPPNVWQCAPRGEFVGVDYQMCLTDDLAVCIKRFNDLND